MKKVILSAIVFSVAMLTGCAERASAPFADQVQVIDFPGQKQQQLFDSSKIWIAKAFTDANSVIQYADKESGSIVGKGNVAYPCEGFNDCLAFGSGVIKFTMKIDTKDQKARLTFSNVTFYSPAGVSGGVVHQAAEFPLGTVDMQQKGKIALDRLAQRYKTEVLHESTAAKDW